MQHQLEFARDIFIFCFCARGLTFVDLAHLRQSDITGNLLVYVRRKTKQRIEVQMEPMMQAVIERYPSDTDYLLPILYPDQGWKSGGGLSTVPLCSREIQCLS